MLADGRAAYATGALAIAAGGSSSDLALLRLRADGTLDPEFGDGGIAHVDTGSISDTGHAVARQADGKLLVAGRLGNGSAYTDWGLVRFTADGQLDTGFGEADGVGGRRGYVRINVAPDAFTHDWAVDLALQSDGRIVVAGNGYQFDCSGGGTGCGFKYARFALARFDANGDLDPGFGDAGLAVSPGLLFQTGELVTGIAKRADGTLPDDDSITVVGYMTAGKGALVRRYLADGSADPAFDGDGVLHITDTVQDGQRTGMVRIDAARLQSNGRLVLAGRAGDRGFVFQRRLANGAVDAGFGSNGRTLVKFSDVTDYDEPSALALYGDDRIVAAGYATGTADGVDNNDFAVVQLSADGQPDAAFGDGSGRAAYPLSDRADAALALAVLTNDALLVAGVAVDEADAANENAAFLRTVGQERIFRDGFGD